LDEYRRRIESRGRTKREASLIREKRMLNLRVPENLSYHTVTIDDVSQDVAIVNSDNLNEKYIYSLPDQELVLGGLVFWKDNYWLINECDANDTVYTRGKLLQCNHLLKWIDKQGEIHEQWCAVEDGTKYLTGEYEDRLYIAARGDTRIAITIARNEFTAKLAREQRFLIDDPQSNLKLAYLLSKPLKVPLVYNGRGVFKFVLQEVVTTDDDNQELGIADYYKYFPKDPGLSNDTPSDDTGKRVWL